jgi:FdhD protein
MASEPTTPAAARGSLFRVVADARPAPRRRGQVDASVVRFRGGRSARVADVVAAEEPLEIRLLTSAGERTVALTMRTPGHDGELAAGFLYAEGVVSRREDLVRLTDCPDAGAGEGAAGADGGEGAAGAACDNRVWAELASHLDPDLAPLERHFFATSACGVCGKAGLESLHQAGHSPLPPGFTVDRRVLAALPERLRGGQGIFDATGGLHAAALFDAAGGLLAVREDVGRHNALDKLIGWALLDGRLPLSEHVVMVSGRSSYEILQKCLAAGVPVVASVSAPSSLAVQLAESFHVTLVGFLRGDRFNVYAAPERVVGAG